MAASPELEPCILVVGAISVLEPSETWICTAWASMTGLADLSSNHARGELCLVI